MKRTVIVTKAATTKAVNTKDARFIYMTEFSGVDAVTGERLTLKAWGNSPRKESAIKNQAKYITEKRIVTWEENNYSAEYHSSNGFLTDLGRITLK